MKKSSEPGTVVTFYSYKGGVGRSMALANVAYVLARRGYRVLAVDWDLEAPGLEHYFEYFDLDASRGGLLPLLEEYREALQQKEAVAGDRYHNHLWTVDVGSRTPLSLLTSGKTGHEDYAAALGHFDWHEFFELGGGDVFERMRSHWKEAYDLVLIDSRTGVSDSGGVCTIQMPDVLVAISTPNAQGIAGLADIVRRAQQSRQRLATDRMALTVLPILSRFPAKAGEEAASFWIRRFAESFGEYTADYLPAATSPFVLFDATKIRHDDRYALGEKLASVEQRKLYKGSTRAAYERLADILGSNFRAIEQAIPAPDQRSAVPLEVPRHVAETPTDYRFDVFISYARTDGVSRDWISALVKALGPLLSASLRSPASILLDTSGPTDERSVHAPDDLKQCRVMLALLTPLYFGSSDCRREWATFEAREEQSGSTLLLPVALGGEYSYPDHARRRQFVAARHVFQAAESQRARELEKLADSLAMQLANMIQRAPRFSPSTPEIGPQQLERLRLREPKPRRARQSTGTKALVRKPPTPEEIFAQLVVILREIVGEDWAADIEIRRETSLVRDLKIDSIALELVVLGERIQLAFGKQVDFTAWMNDLGLERIIDLRVGQVVDFIHARMASSVAA